jgi:adenylate kinase
MAKTFLVFGTPGAGKTTVLRGVRGAETVTLGTELLGALSHVFEVKDRDLLRKAQLSDYAATVRARLSVLRRLAKRKGTLMIDTHASVKSGPSFAPGLSYDDLKALGSRVKAIIYIDANTKDIVRRRNSDKTRKRDKDTKEDLDQHRSMNLMFTAIYSMRLEVPIYIVKNEGGKLREAQVAVGRIVASFKR